MYMCNILCTMCYVLCTMYYVLCDTYNVLYIYYVLRPVPFSSELLTFSFTSMSILHHYPRCSNARTAAGGSDAQTSSASDGNEPSSASDGRWQTGSPAEWSQTRQHEMTLGSPQGDSAVRHIMGFGREFVPRTTSTSSCTLDCTLHCRDCADVIVPQLRRVRESERMDAEPKNDLFVMLVDEKHKATRKHFPGPGKFVVGLYHFYPPRHESCQARRPFLQEGDGPCGSVVDPNPGQIQMSAEHQANSMGAALR